MRRTALRPAIVLGGLLVMALGTTPARAADASVTTEDFAFSPGTVTVSAGDSVTWTNADGTAHTATGASFDTERLDPGQTASVTFADTGSFPYACAIHPQMRGTVVVEAAPAEPSLAAGPSQVDATPPTTDTQPMAPDRRPDIVGSIAVLLAVVGLWMLAATFLTSRRDRR